MSYLISSGISVMTDRLSKCANSFKKERCVFPGTLFSGSFLVIALTMALTKHASQSDWSIIAPMEKCPKWNYLGLAPNALYSNVNYRRITLRQQIFSFSLWIKISHLKGYLVIFFLLFYFQATAPYSNAMPSIADNIEEK